MEVHAHTHTARKKWTHYLWEFLMLFLAVFCGFLAENQREHFIEHKREKQFMVSLVKDLESDTQQLKNIRLFRIDRVRKMDSIILFFARYNSSSVPLQGFTLSGELYGHFGFFQSSGTLEQLKNSGGLRLIRKRNVVDNIESFDRETRRMVLRDQFETDVMIYNVNLVNKLFDGKALTRIYADTSFFEKEAPMPSTLIQLNTLYMDEYLNSIRTTRKLILNNMGVQDLILKKAISLIGLIKQEYHFK